MTVSQTLRATTCLLLAGVSLVATTGCTSTPILNKMLLLDMGSSGEATKTDANTPHVVVTLAPQGGKLRRARVPYREGMVVSDALKQTRATKKFRRQSIEVIRRTEPDGRMVRMAVKLGGRKKRVGSGCDYALYPGDVVHVSEDSTSMIDDVLGGTVGPVGAKYIESNLTAPLESAFPGR